MENKLAKTGAKRRKPIVGRSKRLVRTDLERKLLRKRLARMLLSEHLSKRSKR